MIYAVIVTFNPEPGNLLCLVNALINNQVTPVIVDNGSDMPVSANCKVIALDKNEGIAKAQNIGVEFALSDAAKAIIFFDQDSTLTNDDFISNLYEPIASGRAVVTAPIFIDNARGFTYPIVEFSRSGGRVKHYPNFDTPEFYVNHAISSGTMVEAGALKKIGMMAESLFIDYVDTEWCLRADSLGIKVLIVPRANMIHSIGDKTLKIGRFYIPKHSPFRRYYRIRNSFYLIRQSHIPKVMAIREILFSIIHQCILITFSKGERLAYLKSLFRALKDGLLGRFY
ncbi:rhamnosyltransferase [Pseudoalteromonas carrageenovora]|uniref:glycosyltransferase family 2 protein n=1 Tax=Pseudoalteromonas TaxID=53246 RepID=UPI00073234A7|nr:MULTISPECIES: glycosyltransferase family 2 protein [Pseudoalteromonas]KTF16417.1 hypothetical protein ATS74_15560 [Pseudoalteromonas sp. H103]MDO6635793.1 rhamnosyltransferase [Pseudoalteromonas carrageenovora]MDO6647786.1 rhamnosyltransferase [Pseudoalteromonas carrageenovora]